MAFRERICLLARKSMASVHTDDSAGVCDGWTDGAVQLVRSCASLKLCGSGNSSHPHSQAVALGVQKEGHG